MVGPIDTPHEFVYVPDVGPVLLDLAARPEAYGKWWNLAGAGAITQRQIADEVFRLVGRTPRIRVDEKGAAARACGGDLRGNAAVIPI